MAYIVELAFDHGSGRIDNMDSEVFLGTVSSKFFVVAFHSAYFDTAGVLEFEGHAFWIGSELALKLALDFCDALSHVESDLHESCGHV